MLRVVSRFAVLALFGVALGCSAGDEDEGPYDPGNNGTGATGGGDGDGDGGDGDGDGDGSGGGPGPIVDGDDEFMPGTDPNRNMVQAGNLCRRLAEIQCAGEAFCCDTPRRTREQCTSQMEAGCTEEFGLDALAGNAITGFDTGRAASAFQMFEDLASTCDPSIALWASRDSGLRGIMPGTSSTLCNLDFIGAAGSPEEADAARAALASCSLDQNLACMPSLISGWECKVRGASNECFTDFNCAEGFYCDNPQTSLTGVNCSPRRAAGQPCQYFRECESFICSGGVCSADDVQGAYCLQ